MAIRCPNCTYDNPDNSVACLRCGQPLRQGPASTAGFSQSTPPAPGIFQPNVPPSPPAGNAASFLPQAPQVPQSSQAANMQMGMQQAALPISQMGAAYSDPTSSSSGSHAFAGRGVYVTHQSWLLNENGAAAGELLKTAREICQSRGILNLNIEQRNLQEYGFQAETRYYLILRRGVTTIFLYIAPAGHDLYISRTTTVLTSIDTFRVFSLIALIAIGFLCLISVILILAVIPIGLYLIWFFYRSFRYWLRERDFWVYLRKGELNDFQMDDVALMEHVTDETLQAATKQLKLDSSKIVPPTGGYKPERRIRVV